MSQRKVTVKVCDLCGRDGGDVETHRIAVDGIARDAEVCPDDWAGLVASFALFATAGRAPKAKETRQAKALSWPGTPWRFTSHALLRMGERHVEPADVLRAVEGPEVKVPGRASDQEIWTRAGTKVVVVPDRQVIVTVANRDDDDEEVAR